MMVGALSAPAQAGEPRWYHGAAFPFVLETRGSFFNQRRPRTSRTRQSLDREAT
jgi:hypothetical protein